MSRWKAAGIYLAVSAAVAASVLGLMLLVWYPLPFFYAAGGGHLLLILAGVDVALGPLITLIVFDLKKKSLSTLKFDLAVVAALQLAALGYGIHVVFQVRPVYVVFVKDRFELVTAVEIHPGELAKVARAEFRDLPLTRPKLAGALPPADKNERDRILFAAVLGGMDLHNFPQLYVPYGQLAKDAAAAGLTLAKAREVEPEAAAAIADYLADSGHSEADVRYLPLRARRTWLAAVVDAKTGAVLAFLPVKSRPQ